MQPMSVDPVIEFLFALSDDEHIREEERSDATPVVAWYVRGLVSHFASNRIHVRILGYLPP
jgi:hypothetical protein